MPDTWGMLPKSQIDPEKIEEAIARMIASHNDDETAHLGEGQALQSHKASEIIDHRALSIIQDKIRNNEITSEKLSFGQRFFFNGIQTLDCFNQSLDGTGGSIALEGYGGIVLSAGSSVNNVACVSLSSGFVNYHFEDDAIFECRINDGQDYNADSAVVVGASNPFATNETMIGFRYKQSTNKVYAFCIYQDALGLHTTEKFLFDDVFINHLLRIEVYHDDLLIKFFLNGSLVWSLSVNPDWFFMNSYYHFSFATKRKKVSGSTPLHIWNVFYTKIGNIEY